MPTSVYFNPNRRNYEVIKEKKTGELWKNNAYLYEINKKNNCARLLLCYNNSVVNMLFMNKMILGRVF